MNTPGPQGYNATQIGLHWLVFVAAAFLFFTGDTTTHRYFADLHGSASETPAYWVPLHAIVGVAILAAMIWRLALRHTIGAPPPPDGEAPALRILAQAAHVGLYLDLIAASLIGLAVYFGWSALAGLHELLSRVVLIVLVALHVAGALAHQFYWKDDVMRRMSRPMV
jgi:cytochrome b561